MKVAWWRMEPVRMHSHDRASNDARETPAPDKAVIRPCLATRGTRISAAMQEEAPASNTRVIPADERSDRRAGMTTLFGLGARSRITMSA